MDLIYRLLGYSNSKNRINAAILIQQQYRRFRTRKENDRIKLIESINKVFNDTGYTIISEYTHGMPMMFNERIEDKLSNYDDDDMIFHFNERRRIKRT